jgi:hypothetical protein
MKPGNRGRQVEVSATSIVEPPRNSRLSRILAPLPAKQPTERLDSFPGNEASRDLLGIKCAARGRY